jgi:hypothetical protein
VGWLILFPVVLISGAAGTSFMFVRLSTLQLTADGIEVRNYPQAARQIPLNAAERFEPVAGAGWLGFLRPQTAALVLRDGERVPVRSLRAADGTYGVDALNARLASLRADG